MWGGVAYIDNFYLSLNPLITPSSGYLLLATIHHHSTPPPPPNYANTPSTSTTAPTHPKTTPHAHTTFHPLNPPHLTITTTPSSSTPLSSTYHITTRGISMLMRRFIPHRHLLSSYFKPPTIVIYI